MKSQLADLIHVGIFYPPGKEKSYLFLRQNTPHAFAWFEGEQQTSISADTIEEAIRLANKHWKSDFFRSMNCGFRYTLPERDEHGINALFFQMTASYNTINGVYFDEELGCNCFVQNASIEARAFWEKLKSNEKAK